MAAMLEVVAEPRAVATGMALAVEGRGSNRGVIVKAMVLEFPWFSCEYAVWPVVELSACQPFSCTSTKSR